MPADHAPEEWWEGKDAPTLLKEAAARVDIKEDALTHPALAQALDATDHFASFRSKFLLPSPPPTCTSRKTAIYFCGNSLGPQPATVADRMKEELEKWSKEAVLGWFHGPKEWKTCNQRLATQMARVVGALPSEVAVLNALTVNIHLLLWAFYRPMGERVLILVEDQCFPSDMHALRSHVASRGLNPEEVVVTIPRREGEVTWRPGDVVGRIRELGPRLALIFMSGIHYSTGQAFDMAEITRVGRECGSLVGFDLAHAAGNLCLQLHSWQVDFATWCCYKYLNSGPGAMGAIFVHDRHGSDPTLPRLQGWWGQRVEDRFSFAEPHFIPTPGAEGFQMSTPSPLLSACVEASLNIFEEAGGMPALRQKSVLLTAYLDTLLQELLAGDVTVITPQDPQQRGCQLSCTFRGRSAEDVLAALEAQGIICDVRKPNILRVAPNPLYNSFQDVWDFVDCLRRVPKAP